MYLTFKNLLNTLCLCFRRHCKSEECTGSISKNDDENGEEGMRVNSHPQRHWQPEPEEASESNPVINVLPSPVLQSGPASLVLHGEKTVDDPRPAAATGKSTPVFTCLGPDQYDEVPFPVHRAYQISVVELEDALFDTSPVSTPNMFRLLDCVRFTKERSLLIYETPDIPMVPYMTVSYPWIGVACNERVPPEGKTFELHTTASGARGDPISISILKRIFFLARVENTRFLWIDRLCIRQGDPDDREWQIQRMYTIFKRSQLCIVVPGGLQRLANVYEETPWISRAWTLLEVMAAPKADIVTKMAPTSLDEFLLSSTDPLYGMRLFGRQRHRPLLVDALSLRDLQATDKQRYYHDLSIWKCSLLRTASRREDLIPCVIDLFSTSQEQCQLDLKISRLIQDISDPQTESVCALAFRDAVFLTGAAISSQWKELIQAAITLPLSLSYAWQISHPSLIQDVEYKPENYSISKTYQIPLSELEDTVHDISSISTPCTFRLLDCKKFIEGRRLVIYESSDIPQIPYTVISYPWVGVPCHHFAPVGNIFQVKQDIGRLGDPLCIDMIRLACLTSIQEGTNLLWIDRLCIRQMDSKDKAWQINRMCDVYRLSQLCIVFPGGLQRLVGLYEETPWITRMWTLQEAVTPAKCVVLYSAAPDHTSQGPHDSDATLLRVPSHGKPLISVTSVYYSPLTDLLPRTMSKKTGEIRLFGHVSNGYTLLLRDALDCQGQDATTYEQRYQRYLAMWRSAVSRSSDRPQDLLLSTMGLFDISLGVGQQRSSKSIMTAFVNEFRKQGILDVRVIAFRDAVRRAEAFITAQWRTLIEEFDHSLPLLENGITPTSDYELPLSHAGPPVLHGSLGREVFLGSTLLITGAEHSLHPSRIVVSSSTSFSCIMTYGGKEMVHNGRWELKPFDSEKMEWIPTSNGRSPEDRVPVDGGYEKDVQYMRQRSLYYALASVKNQQGIEEQFIGKTGIHLGGCCFGKDGKENFIRENYMILCWKIGKKNTEFTMSSDAKQDDDLFWSRPNLPLVSGLPVITADR